MGLGYELVGLLQQLLGETVLPSGGLKGRQVVPLPLAKVDQEVADRSRFEGAVALAQQALQIVGEGLLRRTGRPPTELVEVASLLRSESAGLQRLSGLKVLEPFGSPQATQGLLPSLLAQRAKLLQPAGRDPGLAEAEEGLITVKPEPAGRQEGGIRR